MRVKGLAIIRLHFAVYFLPFRGKALDGIDEVEPPPIMRID